MDTITAMRVFVEVVDSGGYSAAARKLGRSKALMSKYVRELEDDLGALLINRTTRQLSLTEAGQSYYETSVDIIDRIKDANESIRDQSGEASGTLRITAPRSLGGSDSMLPLIDFAKAYPDIKLDVNLSDRLVDLVEERFDVAIRVSKLPDSSLIAKRLTANRLVYCASREFIEQHGAPETPKALETLPAIVDTNWRGRENWPFVDGDGQEFTQKVTGIINANDPELCKRAVLGGLGIAMVPEFTVRQEIEAGRILTVLDEFTPKGNAFYAVYAHRRHVSTKVRVFVDFMAKWFKAIG